MSADVTTRAWRDVDLDPILDLLRDSLGDGDRRTRDFFEWKHRRSPFGASPGIVATSGQRPVGLRMFMSWRWVASGREVAAVRAVDTATHRDWRRQGLFRQLTEELVERVREEGADLVFNTPNPQSRAGYLKMGWSSIGRAPLMIGPPAFGRVTDPVRPVSELLEAEGLQELAVSSRAGERRLHTPIDVDYLRWRYVEIPGYSYRALWSFEDGAAAIIGRERQRDGRSELVLSEILVAPDRRSERKAARLVREMARSFDCRYLVASAANATPERAALRRAWFLPPLPIGPQFVVRSLHASSSIPSLETFAGWRLSVGDLEVF